jgi:GNAT superfamily N-acetyltransferase
MIEIHALDRTHLPSLLALYRHLHAEDHPLPAPDEVAKVWAELVNNPRISCFGAFVGGALVSSCTLAVIPNLTRGCKPYALIENVVTHEAHRGRGYGSEVLRVAKAHAWEQGCYRVLLLTGRKDPETLRFYESAGFDPHGKQGFVARPED